MCCVINSEPAHGTDCSNKLHTNIILEFYSVGLRLTKKVVRIADVPVEREIRNWCCT